MMHKELLTIELIREYMSGKGVIKENISSIDDVYEIFEYLSSPENGKKFNSLYILNYLSQYIVSDDVAKRKTSARVFEDLLAILFNGTVADGKKRKNIKSEVPDYFNLIKDKIAGNKREKIDLIFENNYGISLKTLMIDNQEINLGSFEKKVLFDGFNITKFLTERKTESDTGLGSKPRLKNLLTKIKENNDYDAFQERFQKMFNFIFADDFILAIKDSNKMHLYFFTGEEFTAFVSSRADKIDSLLEVVNRWEGNSIRIDRKKLLASCDRKITLDFSTLNETVIKLINEFDYKLHKTYVEYFNIADNNTLRNEIVSEINCLFERFEKDLEYLK